MTMERDGEEFDVTPIDDGKDGCKIERMITRIERMLDRSSQIILSEPLIPGAPTDEEPRCLVRLSFNDEVGLRLNLKGSPTSLNTLASARLC